MSRKIAVFDLDGTLVNTAPDLLDSLNHSLAGRRRRSSSASRVSTACSAMGGRAMIAAPTRRPDASPGIDEHNAALRSVHRTLRRQHPWQIAPYPGLLEALDRLQAAGYLLAICTNKTEAFRCADRRARA